MRSHHAAIGALACALACTVGGVIAAGGADAVVTPRRTVGITVGPTGIPSGRDTGSQAISANGRYVVFDSDAADLVPGDTNDRADVFLKDTVTGTVERISVTSTGGQANGGSGQLGVSVSDDGRYVAFGSYATNLTPRGTEFGLYLRDRVAGTTKGLAATVGNLQVPIQGYPLGTSLSGDGRYLAFSSDSTKLNPNMHSGTVEAYRLDLTTGALVVVSAKRSGQLADGYSSAESISADGRRVAISSVATNLVSGVRFDGNSRSYVKDLVTGTLTLLDQPPGITPAAGGAASYSPKLSRNGAYAAFNSMLPNLPGGVTDRFEDYRRNLATGQIEMISLAPDGTPGDRASYEPALSGDGRYIAFDSRSTNLVPDAASGEIEIFVRDMVDGTTTLISRGYDGKAGDDQSLNPLIAGSGDAVLYSTLADNILRHDLNQNYDLIRVGLARS